LQSTKNVYDKSPNSAMCQLTPNEAQDKQYFDMLFNLNLDKQTYNKTVSDLKVDDTVRVLDTHIFKKGTEPKFSEEIYKVVKVAGETSTIDMNGNNVRYKRNKLLKV